MLLKMKRLYVIKLSYKIRIQNNMHPQKITKMPISLDYIDLYSHFISIIHYKNLLTGKSV